MDHQLHVAYDGFSPDTDDKIDAIVRLHAHQPQIGYDAGYGFGRRDLHFWARTFDVDAIRSALNEALLPILACKLV